jgi:hypothetical protein
LQCVESDCLPEPSGESRSGMATAKDSLVVEKGSHDLPAGFERSGLIEGTHVI